MIRHQLTDAQWNLIKDLFPARSTKVGRPPKDPRTVVNAILWILRTGAPWRDLPEEFGPWSTIWNLFDEWNNSGLLDNILQTLQSEKIDANELDQELWCIDGTVVRAHRCAAGGGKKGIPRNPKTMH